MPLKYLGRSGLGTLYIVDEKEDGTILMLSCSLAPEANAIGSLPDAGSEAEISYPLYETHDQHSPTILNVTPLPSGVQPFPLENVVALAERATSVGISRIELTPAMAADIRRQGPGLSI